MRISIVVMTCVMASCSTTKAAPEPESPASTTHEGVEGSAVETLEPKREAPDITADFEGLEPSQAVDLGDGWVAFGIGPESGVVRAVWYPDGGQPLRREEVAKQEDMFCDRDLSPWAATVGKYVVFYVDCMAGEDNITTESTAYVFETPLGNLQQLQPAWSGVVASENGNQVTGCTDGDNGKLEIRDGQLWLVKSPWSERMPGYEEEEEYGPCEEPQLEAGGAQKLL